MQAFQRSKAPTTQRRQRKIRGTGDGEATIAELVTAESCGDPRYLEVARRAAGDLSKLAGDTVPIAEVKTTDMSQLSTPEVKDRLRRTIAALAPEYPGALEVPESTTSASALPPPRTPVQAYAEFLAERERAKAGG
jgi:hypothetical protein